ncbi:hypothetical protein B0H19DRAFT_1270936 [Mycena capillaripes]|nr:hypothetical protein B0H19DRAFT_1270936 [Mycena capillaripes]
MHHLKATHPWLWKPTALAICTQGIILVFPSLALLANASLIASTFFQLRLLRSPRRLALILRDKSLRLLLRRRDGSLVKASAWLTPLARPPPALNSPTRPPFAVSSRAPSYASSTRGKNTQPARRLSGPLAYRWWEHDFAHSARALSFAVMRGVQLRPKHPIRASNIGPLAYRLWVSAPALPPCALSSRPSHTPSATRSRII